MFLMCSFAEVSRLYGKCQCSRSWINYLRGALTDSWFMLVFYVENESDHFFSGFILEQITFQDLHVRFSLRNFAQNLSLKIGVEENSQVTPLEWAPFQMAVFQKRSSLYMLCVELYLNACQPGSVKFIAAGLRVSTLRKFVWNATLPNKFSYLQ